MMSGEQTDDVAKCKDRAGTRRCVTAGWEWGNAESRLS